MVERSKNTAILFVVIRLDHIFLFFPFSFSFLFLFLFLFFFLFLTFSFFFFSPSFSFLIFSFLILDCFEHSCRYVLSILLQEIHSRTSPGMPFPPSSLSSLLLTPFPLSPFHKQKRSKLPRERKSSPPTLTSVIVCVMFPMLTEFLASN